MTVPKRAGHLDDPHIRSSPPRRGGELERGLDASRSFTAQCPVQHALRLDPAGGLLLVQSLQCALRRAAEGAVLAVSGRNSHALDELADLIASHGHVRPIVLVADLSRRGAAESLAARAVETLGTVDIVINNAAAEGVGFYAAAGDDEKSRELFETNYWSPFVLNRALLPSMRERGFGALVSVSSLGAITPIWTTTYIGTR